MRSARRCTATVTLCARSSGLAASTRSERSTRAVLIVDDNDKNLKLARDVLLYGGFRTLEALFRLKEGEATLRRLPGEADQRPRVPRPGQKPSPLIAWS